MLYTLGKYLGQCFYYCIKYHDQKRLGREDFISPYSLRSIIQRSQGRNPSMAGTWRQEMITYHPAPHCRLSPISYSTQDLQPRDGLKGAKPSPINLQSRQSTTGLPTN